MVHKSAAEHFEKLRKDLERIEGSLHKDNLDDIFKTAYHLAEIAKKDMMTTSLQKARTAELL